MIDEMIDRADAFSTRWKAVISAVSVAWFAATCADYAGFITLPIELPLSQWLGFVPVVLWNALWWGFAYPRIGARRAERPVSHLDTARAMIDAYNAQDVDTYVAFMTDDACEANYRGDVVREGKEGTRSGLAAAFARWPQNRAEIVEAQEIGNYVLMREHVTRGPATDGSPLVEPFDVIAVYSFEGDKCSRVEFIR